MKMFKTAALTMAIIMGLSTAPVYAAAAVKTETAEAVTELTLEQATEMAIKNSNDLKKLNDNKVTFEENADRAKDSLFSSASGSARISYNISIAEINFNKAMNEQNITKQKALLEQTVASYFSTIILAEASYEEYLAGLEIEKANFSIAEVKKELGMISELDYTTAKQTYDTNLAEQASYETEISEAYISLNRAIGEDVDNRYNLIYEVTYEELGGFDLSHHINKVKDVDTELKTLSKDLEDANYLVETYVRRNVDETTGEIVTTKESNDSNRRTAMQASLNISTRRDKIEDDLATDYNDIIEQEKDYREALTALANLKKQYEVKKVEFELGKITQLELDTLAYNILQKENAITQMIYSHQSAVAKFTDVNLAMD